MSEREGRIDEAQMREIAQMTASMAGLLLRAATQLQRESGDLAKFRALAERASGVVRIHGPHMVAPLLVELAALAPEVPNDAS
jgi:hypothetical protein